MFDFLWQVVVNLDEDKVYCLDSAQGTTNDPDDEKPFHFPMPQELEFKLARGTPAA